MHAYQRPTQVNWHTLPARPPHGLSLARKHAESVVLTTPEGHQIKITIDLQKYATPNRINLIIDAPPSVNIRRAELRDNPPQGSPRDSHPAA